jgi:hypothetical protein
VDDKVFIALVGAGGVVVGAALTAVIGPWFKHRSEQSAADSERRRELIKKWRAMLIRVADECEHLNEEVGQALQSHPDFLSLEPLLSEDARRSLRQECRTIVVGQSLPPQLELVKVEIARVAKSWHLE